MNKPFPDRSPFAFSERDLEVSVPQRFERIVELLPEKPAVVHGDRVLSYGDLNSAANLIAHMILARSALCNAPVSLLMQNDLAIFGAILGVLKAGKAYSALNPDFPGKHNRFIVDDLQSELILTDSANLPQALRLAADTRQVFNIEALDASYPTSNPRREVAAGALAAICFTSGTTGMSKGVVRTHANLLHRGLIVEHVCPSRPDDIVSMLYPCSVGASTTDMYVTLLSGATSSIYDVSRQGPDGLAAWLHSGKITRLHLHTSVLRHLLDELPPEAFFPKLRYIRPSDRLYYRDVRRLRRHVPADTVIAHGLSSSEAGNVTLSALDLELGADDEVVPVGFPVPGVRLSLIDENGKQVAPGLPGEIVASGHSVAKGYWCRPELTAEKFQEDPDDNRLRVVKMGDLGRIRSDGCLELVGRKDQMVKIRGHRVEIGLVEATLEGLACVRRAAVLLHEDRVGDQTLVAYVQPANNQETNPSALHRQLREVLPVPMIPGRFILLDSMPMLPNGKVNRRALSSPDTTRPELGTPFAAPRSPTETAVADIWADILGFDQVGIDDSFLDLGGHSLQAARIVSRVLNYYRVDLPPSALFDSPTVAAMALAITQQQAMQLDQDKLDRILIELESGNIEQHG